MRFIPHCQILNKSVQIPNLCDFSIHEDLILGKILFHIDVLGTESVPNWCYLFLRLYLAFIDMILVAAFMCGMSVFSVAFI